MQQYARSRPGQRFSQEIAVPLGDGHHAFNGQPRFSGDVGGYANAVGPGAQSISQLGYGNLFHVVANSILFDRRKGFSGVLFVQLM